VSGDRTDGDDIDADDPIEDDPAEGHDESLIDEMRGSGVGVEDPNIVGRAHPGDVEEHVREDEPPQV
jgi:hypothetical protein